jgi:hypothetical protein
MKSMLMLALFVLSARASAHSCQNLFVVEKFGNGSASGQGTAVTASAQDLLFTPTKNMQAMIDFMKARAELEKRAAQATTSNNFVSEQMLFALLNIYIECRDMNSIRRAQEYFVNHLEAHEGYDFAAVKRFREALNSGHFSSAGAEAIRRHNPNDPRLQLAEAKNQIIAEVMAVTLQNWRAELPKFIRVLNQIRSAWGQETMKQFIRGVIVFARAKANTQTQSQSDSLHRAIAFSKMGDYPFAFRMEPGNPRPAIFGVHSSDELMDPTHPGILDHAARWMTSSAHYRGPEPLMKLNMLWSEFAGVIEAYAGGKSFDLLSDAGLESAKRGFELGGVMIAGGYSIDVPMVYPNNDVLRAQIKKILGLQ